MPKSLFIFLFLFLFIPSLIQAKIGVGVGSGKIVIDEKLKPGMIYKLPALSVMNTGDEPAQYAVSIAYHEKQPELMPKEEWFSYSPDSFLLQPQEAKPVDVTLNLPVNAQPGQYFAYLEAHPDKSSQKGNTSIGIAAAARLYFEVVPTNAISGIYYKILTFWKVNQPWTSRAAIAVMVILAILSAKRFLNIQIGIKNKSTHE